MVWCWVGVDGGRVAMLLVRLKPSAHYGCTGKRRHPQLVEAAAAAGLIEASRVLWCAPVLREESCKESETKGEKERGKQYEEEERKRRKLPSVLWRTENERKGSWVCCGRSYGKKERALGCESAVKDRR